MKKIMSIFVFENKEKKERIWDEEDLSNWAKPFRCLIQGLPDCGKTCLIKNIITRQKPFFTKIYLFHPNERTQEYDGINYEMLTEIPSPEEAIDLFDPLEQNLLIIDDKQFVTASKVQKMNLDKLLSYISTHNNLSVLIACQNLFTQNISSQSTYCNIFCLFGVHNLLNLYHLAAKVGLSYDKLKHLLRNIKNDHDFIVIHKSRPFHQYTKGLIDPISIKLWANKHPF
jgi:hypothetical protein